MYGLQISSLILFFKVFVVASLTSASHSSAVNTHICTDTTQCLQENTQKQNKKKRFTLHKVFHLLFRSVLSQCNSNLFPALINKRSHFKIKVKTNFFCWVLAKTFHINFIWSNHLWACWHLWLFFLPSCYESLTSLHCVVFRTFLQKFK